MKKIHVKKIVNTPITLYTKADAHKQAQSWRRYRHDVFIRFVEKPLNAFLTGKLLNEHGHIVITVSTYLSTAVILLAVYLEITHK